MSQSHWSNAHLAAYKRPATVESKEEPQIECHITNRFRLSLSIQLRSKSTKNPEIHKNTKQCINPNFSRIKFQRNSMEFTVVLRDSTLNLHNWTISPTIQARIHHWKRQIQTRSQRKDWEEEGKKIQRIWTGEGEKKRLPIYFLIQAKNQQKQNQNPKFLKILVWISD